MSFSLRCCLTCASVLGALVGDAGASPEQRFAEAQARFDAAKRKLEVDGPDSVEARCGFHEAAARFAALADDGVVSVNLYVNTGNAYHFAGDDARALLWYLRASHLANTPETRAGLAALRRICKADLWPPGHTSIGRVLMFWHYDLSRRTKQTMLLASYPAGWIMVIVCLLRQRRSLWLRVGVALLLIGGVIGASDVVAAMAPGDQWAVVLEETTGYAGDGEGYSVVVDRMASGQEVKVVESRREWMQVELPSHARCWVRTEVCEAI